MLWRGSGPLAPAGLSHKHSLIDLVFWNHSLIKRRYKGDWFIDLSCRTRGRCLPERGLVPNLFNTCSVGGLPGFCRCVDDVICLSISRCLLDNQYTVVPRHITVQFLLSHCTEDFYWLMGGR